MDTRIYYFTGTGNSSWLARRLAERLQAAPPSSIVAARHSGALTPGEERIGIVAPIYIPFGGAPEPARVDERLARAAQRVEDVAGIIQRGDRVVQLDHDRLRCWVHPGLLYKLGYKFIPGSDGGYHVEGDCNGCGTCARLCPVDNIAMVDERPCWNQRCEQCMACLQWCPREAIQIKDKTQGERRYHHPEITVKDLIAQKG